MKVAELLDAWPELEDVLVAQAPEFQKLRNPILRRTVARVATLAQAAAIGGLSSRDLVTTLRRAAGQPVDDDDGVEAPAWPEAHTPPAWLDGARVRRRIDADALLAEGQVPLGPVNAEAQALDAGEILEVLASFRPVPLVESLEKQGFRCHLAPAVDGRFCLSVARPGTGAP